VQEKVVFDTSIYIGIFNHGIYQHEISGLNKVMYMAHPVLHELWIGSRGNAEIKHLIRLGSTFVKSGRLIQPDPATQILIGRVCHKLRFSGKLDPKNTRDYNDVCIALLARQIGATVITRNVDDFKRINEAIDFNFRGVS
jgi:predicted nucleic acid-binding protein